ncbi:DUF4249 domain-containing protein [Chitinophaga sp.]|uniref:DUF4249 domain-containing protein n=1 Tax=Chitinophaga sp. TaxID=1869181 RepID=UPI0031DB8222
MKKILSILSTSFILSSCEKEIHVDLNSSEPQIVIDGSITDAAGPYYVRITKTVNYSESNVYPGVSGATVIISDNNGITDTLTETSPGIYQTSTIIGTPGNTYSLSVSIEDKEYYATSTMPLKVNLDSLKFSPTSVPGEEDLYSILPVFTDPPTLGNNYRYLLTINGKLDDSYFVDNDNIGNGLVNKRSLFTQDTDIKLKDSVKLEMRCIDLPSYTYFYTLSQIADGGPGGGTTPTNPPNNITGDYALGIFSAYTTQTRTQIVE